MMQQAPYRFASVTGPDGRQRSSAEVFGPLPDPLLGLGQDDRRAVLASRRSWGELLLMMQTRHYPLLAREAIGHFLLSRRRLRYETRRAETRQTATVPQGDDPDVVDEQDMQASK